MCAARWAPRHACSLLAALHAAAHHAASAWVRGHLKSRAPCARSLAAALHAAREGTGEVRRILLSATFRPRLPGARPLPLAHALMHTLS